MIDRQHGKITIECDSCSETFEGEKGEDWNVVWPAAQREGWKSRKIGDEWVHGCPKCGV
jgi:hypothetical protein